MTWTASLDALLEQSPIPFSNSQNWRTEAVCLGAALASWVLGETLMAPVLKPLMVGLWLGYGACFFLFIAWYFRVSRLFDAPWTLYSQAWAPMVWVLTPLHLVFPAALLFTHGGLPGMLAYELVKAGVIVAVLSRLMRVLQSLNHWPKWSALVLALSPLAVAFAGVVVMLSVGGLAVIVLALNALH